MLKDILLRRWQSRSVFETIFVIAVTLVFAVATIFLGAIKPKFQVAFAIGLLGLTFLALIPQKRTFLLFSWVLITPLSIEKVLHHATPFWDGLEGMTVVMNAGDVILMMIAGLLLWQQWVKKESAFVWSANCTLLLAFLLWAIISFATHKLYLNSSYVHGGPYGILHLCRLLAFCWIMQSAIQTRSDLIWILVAVLLALLFQSLLVMMSFATKESYSFMRLIGGPIVTQSYNGTGGQEIFRASGTLGVANQQGLYHAMFTFLLIGLLAVKNNLFRMLAILGLLLSFIGVLFTFSRGAWLCLFCASIVIFMMFYQKREIKPHAWLVGAVLAILFAAALSVVIQPIVERLTSGDNGATGSRVRMMLLAKDLFLHHPIIGTGPAEYIESGLHLYPPGYAGNEWVEAGKTSIVPPLGRVELSTTLLPDGKYFIVPLSVHNKFLLVLSEMGAVGLFLWLAIFYGFYHAARRLSRHPQQFFSYLGMAGMGVLTVSLVYMNIDLFSDDKTMQVLFYPLIFILAAERISRRYR